ncbi:hypothetical protein MLD38_033515 [Melastoma candidum]|uniref:Uncharacterized protein n=1 Tax=Melastoma candidum TaxID=119954 RepID=A0ACB9M7L2_9MYRT|nr:hypothetical protein MLD38_033515 [Melastoma candidum]
MDKEGVPFQGSFLGYYQIDMSDRKNTTRMEFTKINQARGLRRLMLTGQTQCFAFRLKHHDHGFVDRPFPPRVRGLDQHHCGDPEAAYHLWQKDHPSALKVFDRITKPAKGKRIVVFLDYDGTLSPIVNDPDRAFMTDEMRSAVKKVSNYFPTAIISGRSRDKVKEFVRLENVYYAGSHGMDIMSPPASPESFPSWKHSTIPALHQKGNGTVFQPARNYLPAVQEMLAAIEKQIANIQGARVEDNRFCISVHYRQVKEEDLEMLEQKVISVLQKYPDFHLTRGKMVMEIRPSIEWNKGHALEYLLEKLGFKDSTDVLPLYIGDDRTDEDAFKVIQRRGQGYPIIVSSIPKETKASYSLRDPSEVLAFLSRLARWRKASSSSNRSSAQIWGLGD